MIAEFLYPSWWPFSCHEYAPSDIHGFDDIKYYLDDRSGIPRSLKWLDAAKGTIREVWIARWMEQNDLIHKKMSELTNHFLSKASDATGEGATAERVVCGEDAKPYFTVIH